MRTLRKHISLIVLAVLISADPVGLPLVGQEHGQRIRLAYCKPGSFTMGSPPTEKGREGKYMGREDQRNVTISHGFWISKTEITQSQWKSVMRTEPWTAMPSVPTGPDCPVCYVSWVDAMDFCRQLTAQEHHAGRLEADWEYTLPTEAQWEYACRAGTTTAFWFGNDASQLDRYEWYVDSDFSGQDYYGKYGLPVAMKRPNPWGLYDMHGNLSEWCRDSFKSDEDFDPLDPAAHPQNVLRVIRGGSWQCRPEYCRSAVRSNGAPKDREGTIGFRVVKVPID